MELYQLKTFVKIADEGSLTRAAALLFTSQPAISAQVKALEEELGVTLFERSSKGMTLTAKGRQLYTHANATLAAAAQLKDEAQSLRQVLIGQPKVGVHTDFEFMRIGRLHQKMAATHPRVKPHFLQSMSARILPDVRRGALDAGFFFGDCSVTELAVDNLLAIPTRLVGPADWAERLAHAGVTDLVEMPWVYTSRDCPYYVLAERFFATEERQPDQVASVDSEDAVRALIRAGAGLSLLREDDALNMAAQQEAAIWPGETPGIRLGFAYHKQRAGEPLIQALRELVADVWSDEQDAEEICRTGG